MNCCEICGQPWGDHHQEVDSTRALGLWGPVPDVQEDRVYLTCPFVEDEPGEN